ncbi:MAG: hypothetical protein AAGF98_04970 [Cyanobacteria bacterium P01_H01_bin.153]
MGITEATLISTGLMGYLLSTAGQILGLIGLVSVFGLGLSLFNAGVGVWTVTGMLMIYLLQVGHGALLPASLWATLLISLLVIHDRFPVAVLSRFPDFAPQGLHYRYWAVILLGLWAIAIGIFFLLGRYSDWRQRTNDCQWTQGIRVGSVIIGLALGHQLGHLWLASYTISLE